MNQRKLGVIALSTLLLFGSMTACSGSQVAQDIVNWTPTIVSTATTVGQVVAALDPTQAIIISGVTAGFVAAANLVQAQAQTYLKNPSATTLQQLQAQVLAFQQNVNTALLQAVKITNPGSQQQVLIAIQALSTGITAVLALIATIKGNTLSTQSIIAPGRVSRLVPLMDHKRMVEQIASHYGESNARAEVRIQAAELQLQAAGL